MLPLLCLPVALALLCGPAVGRAQEPAPDGLSTVDGRNAYDTEALVEESQQLTAADLPRLKASAEAGDPRAQVLLGLAYEFGSAGLTREVGEALSWFMKAAEQGIAWAEAWAADFYFNGSGGTPRDLSKALALYTSAANRGEGRAAFFVGQMYFYGDGVAIGFEQAAGWFRRSVPVNPELAGRMVELAEVSCDTSFCVSLRQVMGAITTGAPDRFIEGWNDGAREWDATVKLPGSDRCGLTSSDRTSAGDVQNYFCDSAPVDDEARGIAMAKRLADEVQQALPAGYQRTERTPQRPGPSTFFARDGYPHLRVTFNITPGSAQRRVTLLVGP
jgi:hypothetical protein